MTEAIVWAVLWGIFGLVGAPVIYLTTLGLFTFVGVQVEGDSNVGLGFSIFGAILGWLGGIAWLAFSAVQVILSIVNAVQIGVAT